MLIQNIHLQNNYVAVTGAAGFIGSNLVRELLETVPGIKIVAVEPADSPVLSGGQAAPHKIQGIGANFVPEVLDLKIVDRVIGVTAENAARTAREAAVKEGLLIGISGGAALYAALELAKEPAFENKRIVVILPDSGERYLSSWLFE